MCAHEAHTDAACQCGIQGELLPPLVIRRPIHHESCEERSNHLWTITFPRHRLSCRQKRKYGWQDTVAQRSHKPQLAISSCRGAHRSLTMSQASTPPAKSTIHRPSSNYIRYVGLRTAMQLKNNKARFMQATVRFPAIAMLSYHGLTRSFQKHIRVLSDKYLDHRLLVSEQSESQWKKFIEEACLPSLPCSFIDCISASKSRWYIPTL